MIDMKKEYIGELEEISRDIDSLISRLEVLDIEKASREDSEELSHRVVKLITSYKDVGYALEDIEWVIDHASDDLQKEAEDKGAEIWNDER